MSKKASIIFGSVVGVIIILWLWTLLIPKNYVSIGGSTSVDPVMQRLTNKYSKDNKKESNFIYSSSGSRGGLSNMESGIYQMGFISREIDDLLAKQVVGEGQGDDGPTGFSFENDLSQNSDAIYNYLVDHQKYGTKLDYFQMGTDAIILTYHPTVQFQKYYADKFAIDPKDPNDQRLIFDIYQKKVSFRMLAKIISGETEQQVNQKLTDLENDQPILPYSRETGSGTRNSFEGLFNFKAYEKDTGGEPSKAYESNSNGIMYSSIERAPKSFGYLSLNYLRSIKSNGTLKAVLIKNADGSLFDPLADQNFEKGEIVLENFKNYQLTRPYIGLFKANQDKSTLKKIANFLAWISEANKTTGQNASRTIYQIEGLIPEMKFNFKITQ